MTEYTSPMLLMHLWGRGRAEWMGINFLPLTEWGPKNVKLGYATENKLNVFQRGFVY